VKRNRPHDFDAKGGKLRCLNHYTHEYHTNKNNNNDWPPLPASVDSITSWTRSRIKVSSPITLHKLRSMSQGVDSIEIAAGFVSWGK
jgi:hypothetical protein